MEPVRLSGGCLCGGVRFSLSQQPRHATYCHCTRCQRRTGTGSSAQAQVDAGTLTIERGEDLMKAWRHPDGGWAKIFCRECGAHLFSRNPEEPSRMSVRMGAFDSDPGVRPQLRAWTASAAAWEPIPDDGLPRYGGARPRA